MNTYSIYEKSTGKITRILTAEDEPVLSDEEDFVIGRFDYNQTYIKDKTAFRYPQKISDYLKWDLNSESWVLDSNLITFFVAFVKTNIDKERDKRRFSGVIYNNILFDSDLIASANLTGWATAITAGVLIPENFTWRSMDNRDIPFTSEDVIGLAAVTINKTTACYQRAWKLKEEVDALFLSSDYQSIIDLHTTTGWPE